MKTLVSLLISINLLVCSTSAGAATEYDIELIIFADNSGRYANSELWQRELETHASISAEAQSEPTRKATTTRTTATETAPGITKIKGIGLEPYARKLKASKRYKVLVHKAWRQPGLPKKEAIAIPIDTRAKSTAAQQASSIHGTIKVALARYLHVYADMIYQQPRKQPAPVWAEGDASQYVQYPIQSHRRMRSKELHYIDHPLVGILVKAMPVKTEQKTEKKT
jgi:hypothetical protein